MSRYGLTKPQTNRGLSCFVVSIPSIRDEMELFAGSLSGKFYLRLTELEINCYQINANQGLDF